MEQGETCLFLTFPAVSDMTCYPLQQGKATVDRQLLSSSAAEIISMFVCIDMCNVLFVTRSSLSRNAEAKLSGESCSLCYTGTCVSAYENET